MRALPRMIILSAALALPLGGCVNFDPVDWFSGEWFNTKKPLPGDRKELFPEGVPGVARGVPADLVKGNQAAALQEERAAAPESLLPEQPKAKPRPKAKPKPKPKVVQETAQPERQPTVVTVRPQGQPPAQPPQRSPQQWPDPPAATGQTRSPGVGGTQWPDPPAPR